MVQQSAVAGVIGVAGDGLMQMKEMQAKEEMEFDCVRSWQEFNCARSWQEFDCARAVNLACFRMAQAPIVDLIWQSFDRRITVAGPAAVGLKVLGDQLLIAPPSLTAFFICQSALEGESTSASVERAKTMFAPTYTLCLPFWCCVHTVTFGLIPSHFRIAWASLCAVGWNAFLSNQNQTAKEEAQR